MIVGLGTIYTGKAAYSKFNSNEKNEKLSSTSLDITSFLLIKARVYYVPSENIACYGFNFQDRIQMKCLKRTSVQSFYCFVFIDLLLCHISAFIFGATLARRHSNHKNGSSKRSKQIRQACYTCITMFTMSSGVYSKVHVYMYSWCSDVQNATNSN